MEASMYQALAARTINKNQGRSDWEQHAMYGMAAEVGELHGIYQKCYQGHEPAPDHVKKELGDLLWFIAEYCTAMCWDLGEIMELNIDKLRDRYPGGFEADRSLHRADGDI